jgi:hypothetical protein
VLSGSDKKTLPDPSRQFAETAIWHNEKIARFFCPRTNALCNFIQHHHCCQFAASPAARVRRIRNKGGPGTIISNSMSLKKHLTGLAASIESNFDAFALKLRKRFNAGDPLQIVTYRSYGTVNRLYVKGRVLKDKNIRKATDRDTVWNNLLSMYKRFESDEVPGARLKITFSGKEHLATTDEEGYFVINLSTEVPITWESMWHHVDVELIDAPYSLVPGVKTTADVLVPPADA